MLEQAEVTLKSRAVVRGCRGELSPPFGEVWIEIHHGEADMSVTGVTSLREGVD